MRRNRLNKMTKLSTSEMFTLLILLGWLDYAPTEGENKEKRVG